MAEKFTGKGRSFTREVSSDGTVFWNVEEYERGKVIYYRRYENRVEALADYERLSGVKVAVGSSDAKSAEKELMTERMIGEVLWGTGESSDEVQS